MKKYTIALLCLICLLNTIATVVYSAENENTAGAFGLNINQALFPEVKNKIIEQCGSIEEKGINIYSNGKMISAPCGMGIENAQNVLFVFTSEDKLTATAITYSKSNTSFNEFFNIMKNKYILTSKENPFVGNKKANFKSGNIFISIEEFHMDFSGSILYASDDFLKALNTALENKKKNKQKNTESAL